MLAAQLIHASGESSPGDLPVGTHAIALEARDSAHLAEIAQSLRERQLPHCCITENDEPYQGELMAIGVVPAPKSTLRRALSSLPLVRDPRPAQVKHRPAESDERCPWCGTEPAVQEHSRFEVWFGCVDDCCDVSPFVYDHTEELARECWNKRYRPMT